MLRACADRRMRVSFVTQIKKKAAGNKWSHDHMRDRIVARSIARGDTYKTKPTWKASDDWDFAHALRRSNFKGGFVAKSIGFGTMDEFIYVNRTLLVFYFFSSCMPFASRFDTDVHFSRHVYSFFFCRWGKLFRKSPKFIAFCNICTFYGNIHMSWKSFLLFNQK